MPKNGPAASATAADAAAADADRDMVTLSEPEAFKAIAHPARFRIIEELYSGRELTATEAAEVVGLTPSAMSYHLRALERFGLVERGQSDDGRERPWRRVAEHLGFANQVGGVSPAVAQAVVANMSTSIDRLLRRPHAAGKPFGATVTKGLLRLTDEQAAELDRRVGAVIEEFEADEPPAGPDAPPAREFYWIRGDAERA
ncbi:ArsR/SmtB family transcription factor [Desertimonas flava]|uniref:ArsR/SmtB family transcription factor n=1 Tax=Desertimonas flava TaxID=2064846 RepID=UPI0013C51E77|nr:metalloregulator ArsR/SmtB family transcription factor [Desertimonas flava]